MTRVRAGRPGSYARLVLALTVASVLVRVLVVFAPPLSDEAMHLVGSWTLLDGGRLYLDFVDNKPPLLYALYAGAQVLLGEGLPAVRGLNAVIIVPLTAYAAFVFHDRSQAGLAAAALYLIAGVSFALEMRYRSTPRC